MGKVALPVPRRKILPVFQVDANPAYMQNVTFEADQFHDREIRIRFGQCIIHDIQRGPAQPDIAVREQGVLFLI